MRRTVAALVALVVVAVVAWVVSSRAEVPQPAVARAAAAVPDETLTLAYTDWAAIRSELDPSVDSGSPVGERERVLLRAYDRDLTSLSVLAGAEPLMADGFGWSVLDAEWEALALSTRGRVLVLGLGDGLDAATVTGGLERVGWDAPDDEPSAGGVWTAAPEATLGAGAPADLAAVAVLEDDGLVVMSDDAAYAARTVDVVRGDVGSLGDDEQVASVLGETAGAQSLELHTGAAVCSRLGFDDAPADVAAVADGLLTEAGVGTLDVAATALGVGGDLSRVDLVGVVPAGADAAAEAEARAGLAGGEAVGQGGTFGERFEQVDVRTSGRLLDLELRVRGARSLAYSDVAPGPLLPLACG